MDVVVVAAVVAVVPAIASNECFSSLV